MQTKEDFIIEQLRKENKVIPAIRDIIFKKVMIDHLDYLAVILENIIGIPKEDVINNGIFINNELPANNLNKRSSITDLTLSVGNIIISLEANRRYSTSLEIRNRRHLLDIATKEYSKKDKVDLKKSIFQILFNNYKYISDKLILHIHQKDEDNEIIPDEIFTNIHLNLEKAKELYYNNSKLDLISKYLVILVLEKKDEILELAKGDEILERVAKDILSYSEKVEIVSNFLHEVHEETEKDIIAHENLEKGLEAGKTEGLKQGIEKGIKQGTIEERKKNTKAMLKENIPIETISKITGLSIKEIKNIK